MGNYFTSYVEDMQKRTADEMRQRQFQMQCHAQERMRRAQLAMAVAAARERVWWFGGTYTMMICGA